MNKVLLKYALCVLVLSSLMYLLKLADAQSKEIRDLKDKHTSELYQIDSLQQIHDVTKKQFNKLILSKDSVLNSELEKRDIKINQLNNIIKTHIDKTIIVRDTILNNIEIIKDTIIPIVKTIECITIYGTSEIQNEKLNLVVDSINFNINITVIDYYDIIYWYNFRKRKEYGYNAIGFRNHYINKVTATSDCFGDRIKVQSYKLKK